MIEGTVVSLADAASKYVADRDAANAAHGRKQRAEQRDRDIAEGRALLTKLLADDPRQLIAPPKATVADPEHDNDERIVFEVGGLRLLYHPRSHLGYDYGYGPDYFSLLEPCDTCGGVNASTSLRIANLYDLGVAVNQPAPTTCEDCWSEEEVPGAAPMAPPTTEERLLETLRQFIDERMPYQP